MKKILLITPLYPIPTKDSRITPVCHFFAREWKKMGYDIISVHLQPVHIWMWHLAVRLIGNYGSKTSYPHKLRKIEHYTMDKVPVYRIPIYQLTPHFQFSRKSVDKFVRDVVTELEKLDFVPDIIVGHCMAPHIIPVLNEKYHAKTVMVAHGAGDEIKKLDNWEDIFDSYDAWGFRAEPIQQRFEKMVKKAKKSFICYSGIPERFVSPHERTNFKLPLSKFIFVGRLSHNKYPIALLKAIPRVFDDFSIEIIGDGTDLDMLQNYVKDNNLSSKVIFCGRIKREDVVKHLDNADCFILVSGPEAFGLSYVEAMARGCLTIGSRGEGIDGVIVHGVNGFLSGVGNDDELADILREIKKMSEKELLKIAHNGYETAKRMTDPEMAKDYMDKLESV